MEIVWYLRGIFYGNVSAVSTKRVEVVLFIEVRLRMEYKHLSAELSAAPR
jgi:hypothetical protein